MRRKRTISRSSGRKAGGFSLVEMMVVIALIVIIASATLPSVITLFNAGADAEAYNLLTAQLTAARAVAIREATYAAVHVQRADTSEPYLSDMTDAFFSTVMVYKDPDETDDDPNRYFQLAQGATPRLLPGAIAFGEIDAGTYKSVDEGDLEDFTTFSIVFSPNGSVVRNVGGADVVFRTPNEMALVGSTPPADPVFWNDDRQTPPLPLPQTKLWSPELANRDTNAGNGPGEPGTTAVVIFDYPACRSAPNRTRYLDANGRLVPVNIHTGQLFSR